MAELKNDKLGWRFELPDNPDVLTVLRYDSRLMELRGQPLFIVSWEAAKTVIVGWKCELLPDIKTPLSELRGNKAAQIVEGVGILVAHWRATLDATPKN